MAGLSRRGRANLMLLVTSIIWGFAFVSQVQVGSVGPFTVNATRFAMGAATLVPVIVWNDRRQGVDRAWGRREWRAAFWPAASGSNVKTTSPEDSVPTMRPTMRMCSDPKAVPHVAIALVTPARWHAMTSV